MTSRILTVGVETPAEFALDRLLAQRRYEEHCRRVLASGIDLALVGTIDGPGAVGPRGPMTWLDLVTGRMYPQGTPCPMPPPTATSLGYRAWQARQPVGYGLFGH